MDIIAGNSNASFQNLGSITQHVKGGKMKLLAVTSDKRDPSMPNVPTLAEAGVSGLEVFSWQAIVAPRGLPKDVSDKIVAAVLQASKDPGVVKKLNDIGFEVVGGTPAEFSKFLDSELARWKGVIDAGGIKQSD
jgi:tripartite-type tricarboxylate transporter receptor subunit TctC